MRPDAGPPALASTPASEREFVEAEAFRSFLDALPAGLASGAFGALVIAWMLRHVGVESNVEAWLAGVLAALACSYLAYRRYRSVAHDATTLRRWGRVFVGLALVSAFAWGTAAFYFLPGTAAVEIVAMLGVAVIVIGGIGQMAAYLPAYLAFMLASELPFAIALARLGDPLHTALAAGVCALMVGLPWFAIQSRTALTHSLALAYHNRELATALARRSDEAERANQAKSRFLAVASHDLRQPVHSMRLLVDMLARYPLGREPQSLVLGLQQATAELDAWFDALLDISRIEAASVQVVRKPFHLDELLHRLHFEYTPDAGSRNLRLRVRTASCTVLSDPLLLQRILRNLIANALKFTERGGILLATRVRRHVVAVEIWDTGAGIPANEQAAVFEPFYQGRRAPIRDGRGLGLGLAIVRGLATLLDHPLELHSRPGRGTRVRILLPRLS